MKLSTFFLATTPLGYLVGASPTPQTTSENSVTLLAELQTIVSGTLTGIDGALETSNFDAVLTYLQSVVPLTTSPTSPEDAIAQLQLVNSTLPANLFDYLANLEALNLVDSVTNLLQFVQGVQIGMNSMNNINPDPPTQVYPQKCSCDAPYSVDETSLRGAIYIPAGFTYGAKPPVILFPGTGGTGYTTFIGNYIPLLTDVDYADPVWVNVPGYLLDDAQINAEYAAYAVNYISALTSTNVTVVAWSQGNINSQWAYKYWPCTRLVVSDHVAISADYDGTILADFISPPGTPLPPSILQQRYLGTSNFIDTLHTYNGDSAYVPTTSVYSGLFDEIVEPQQGTGASAFINDIRNVGTSNSEAQVVCVAQPAGTFYTHEGMLYNPLGFALFRDAMVNPGAGQVADLDTTAVCSTYLIPGLDLGDFILTENTLLVAGLAILLYTPKVTIEPTIMPYALQPPVTDLSQCTPIATSTPTTTSSTSTSTLTASTAITTTTLISFSTTTTMTSSITASTSTTSTSTSTTSTTTNTTTSSATSTVSSSSTSLTTTASSTSSSSTISTTSSTGSTSASSMSTSSTSTISMTTSTQSGTSSVGSSVSTSTTTSATISSTSTSPSTVSNSITPTITSVVGSSTSTGFVSTSTTTSNTASTSTYTLSSTLTFASPASSIRASTTTTSSFTSSTSLTIISTSASSTYMINSASSTSTCTTYSSTTASQSAMTTTSNKSQSTTYTTYTSETCTDITSSAVTTMTIANPSMEWNVWSSTANTTYNPLATGTLLESLIWDVWTSTATGDSTHLVTTTKSNTAWEERTTTASDSHDPQATMTSDSSWDGWGSNVSAKSSKVEEHATSSIPKNVNQIHSSATATVSDILPSTPTPASASDTVAWDRWSAKSSSSVHLAKDPTSTGASSSNAAWDSWSTSTPITPSPPSTPSTLSTPSTTASNIVSSDASTSRASSASPSLNATWTEQSNSTPYSSNMPIVTQTVVPLRVSTGPINVAGPSSSPSPTSTMEVSASASVSVSGTLITNGNAASSTSSSTSIIKPYTGSASVVGASTMEIVGAVLMALGMGLAW